MFAERGRTFPIAQHGGLGHGAKHLRQCAGMVQLGMVADHVIHARKIDQRSNVPQQLVGKWSLDRVDQGGLLVAQQIGVVGGAALGVVAVEVADRPVDGADPVDVFV